MSVTGEPDEPLHLSAREMREWLLQEIRDSMKACELRVREATAFVTAYAVGELSPEQAMERLNKYEDRWGEALCGTKAASHMTDDQIVGQIDQMRSTYGSLRAMRERYERRWGKLGSGPAER